MVIPSTRRSNKLKGKSFREVQEQYQETVVGLCLSCQKPVKGGWYGRWDNLGTCSKKCEQIQATRPKFPEHSEEDFLQRFQLGVSHEIHASPSGQDDQASPVPDPAGADVASGGDD